MVARDIALAELTGGRLHLAHLSSAGSVALVRQAKDRGIPVTAEVCPHHLLLTDEWALGVRGNSAVPASAMAYDTSTKVYPPLRTDADVAACVAGLADGTIDCVATDHAPHDRVSKECTYHDAAFGISVLETALGTVLATVHDGAISLTDLVERMTAGAGPSAGRRFRQVRRADAGRPRRRGDI